MKISELNSRDMREVIDLYLEHKKEFYDIITIEDFIEQFTHRCDNCNHIIFIEDNCEECNNNEEFDKDFEYFDREKEHYVYELY